MVVLLLFCYMMHFIHSRRLGPVVGAFKNKRQSTFCERFGPTLLMAFATCAVMLDQTRHVSQDYLTWMYPDEHPPKWMGMFVWVDGKWELSTTGKEGVVATWVGVGAMCGSIMWHMQLQKLE